MPSDWHLMSCPARTHGRTERIAAFGNLPALVEWSGVAATSPQRGLEGGGSFTYT